MGPDAYNGGVMQYRIGIDEVGRGPLAGPVAVCAFAIPQKNEALLAGIRDSKKMTAKEREEWVSALALLKERGEATWHVSFVGPQQIDKNGIVPSIRLALGRSLKKINCNPKECAVYLDGGLYAPVQYKNQETIIRGEDREVVIASASVIAKVARDRKMVRLAKQYPEYGFERHKGYGTKAHREAIEQYGLCAMHRKSFCHFD